MQHSSSTMWIAALGVAVMGCAGPTSLSSGGTTSSSSSPATVAPDPTSLAEVVPLVGDLDACTAGLEEADVEEELTALLHMEESLHEILRKQENLALD